MTHSSAVITDHKPVVPLDINQETLEYLSVADYDYELPDTLIARYPLAQRSASKLLYLPATAKDKPISHPKDYLFTALPSLLSKGDLVIFNDTKVMKARLFGHKDTGGKVEVLIERIIKGTDVDVHIDIDSTLPIGQHLALCHIKASKAPKIGQHLSLANNTMHGIMIARQDNLFVLSFDAPILPVCFIIV